MEEIEQLIGQMLNGAFQQGMAQQRIVDAQADFDSHIEGIGASMLRIKELLNIGEDKQEVQ